MFPDILELRVENENQEIYFRQLVSDLCKSDKVIGIWDKYTDICHKYSGRWDKYSGI